jgi:hypothetical protein
MAAIGPYEAGCQRLLIRSLVAERGLVLNSDSLRGGVLLSMSLLRDPAPVALLKENLRLYFLSILLREGLDLLIH